MALFSYLHRIDLLDRIFLYRQDLFVLLHVKLYQCIMSQQYLNLIKSATLLLYKGINYLYLSLLLLIFIKRKTNTQKGREKKIKRKNKILLQQLNFIKIYISKNSRSHEFYLLRILIVMIKKSENKSSLINSESRDTSERWTRWFLGGGDCDTEYVVANF